MSQTQTPLKIKNLIPLTNGIFSHMNYTFREEVTKANLDLQFVANNGMRNISPIVEIIDNGDGTVFDNTKLSTLAGIILETYKPKWDKLGEIYDIQYDPIHNYLDEWEETDDIDGTLSDNRIRTDTFTHGKIVTEDISRNDIGNGTTTKSQDTSTTRTDNLATAESKSLDSTVRLTDNLQEQTTYGKQNTRTDNLSEALTKSETDTRTDNLQQETFFGKSDTRTDNLTEEVTYGKTDTRTDNLVHQIKGSETTTPTTTQTTEVYPFNSSTSLNTDIVTDGGSTVLSFTNRENDDTGTQTHALSGKDTTKNTGTQTSQLAGSDRTKNTGTQQNAISGTETTLNTGTQTDVNSGSDVTANTGTRTTVTDEDGLASTTHTGTQTVVGDNDETVTSSNSNSRSVHDVTGYTGSDTSNESTSKSRTTTNDIDKTGRHFGNIGNLTSQKQILEEINLWRWNYVNEILNDVKEFTTLPVYLNATSYYA